MAFQDNETLQEQPAHAEVFRFWNNATNYYYTSYITDLTIGGNLYSAVHIKRSDISYDPGGLGTKVKIQAPVTGPFVKYVSNVPFVPINVTIHKYYLSDLASSRLLFSGKIKSVSVNGNLAEAECQSKETILNKKIPFIVYQSLCNHELFDARCGITEALYSVSGAIVAIIGSSIFVAECAAKADAYFTNGYITFGDDIRLVTRHIGTQLDLHVPFGSDLVVGSAITAYAGCDKAAATCKTKFNNIANFVGMPYIPDKNPTIYAIRQG